MCLNKKFTKEEWNLNESLRISNEIERISNKSLQISYITNWNEFWRNLYEFETSSLRRMNGFWTNLYGFPTKLNESVRISNKFERISTDFQRNWTNSERISTDLQRNWTSFERISTNLNGKFTKDERILNESLRISNEIERIQNGFPTKLNEFWTDLYGFSTKLNNIEETIHKKSVWTKFQRIFRNKNNENWTKFKNCFPLKRINIERNYNENFDYFWTEFERINFVENPFILRKPIVRFS